MGVARIEARQGDFAAALQTVNEVHVKHTWFAPALMEKMHLSLVVHGWKETMECVAQLQQKDANNVLAYAYHGALLNSPNSRALCSACLTCSIPMRTWDMACMWY